MSLNKDLIIELLTAEILKLRSVPKVQSVPAPPFRDTCAPTFESFGDPIKYACQRVIKLHGPALLVQLSDAEVQSGTDPLGFAENLIRQLDRGHEGRNTWLLNYGCSNDAEMIRARYDGPPVVAAMRKVYK